MKKLFERAKPFHDTRYTKPAEPPCSQAPAAPCSNVIYPKSILRATKKDRKKALQMLEDRQITGFDETDIPESRWDRGSSRSFEEGIERMLACTKNAAFGGFRRLPVPHRYSPSLMMEDVASEKVIYTSSENIPTPTKRTPWQKRIKKSSESSSKNAGSYDDEDLVSESIELVSLGTKKGTRIIIEEPHQRKVRRIGNYRYSVSTQKMDEGKRQRVTIFRMKPDSSELDEGESLKKALGKQLKKLSCTPATTRGEIIIMNPSEDDEAESLKKTLGKKIKKLSCTPTMPRDEINVTVFQPKDCLSPTTPRQDQSRMKTRSVLQRTLSNFSVPKNRSAIRDEEFDFMSAIQIVMSGSDLDKKSLSKLRNTEEEHRQSHPLDLEAKASLNSGRDNPNVSSRFPYDASEIPRSPSHPKDFLSEGMADSRGKSKSVSHSKACLSEGVAERAASKIEDTTPPTSQDQRQGKSYPKIFKGEPERAAPKIEDTTPPTSQDQRRGKSYPKILKGEPPPNAVEKKGFGQWVSSWITRQDDNTQPNDAITTVPGRNRKEKSASEKSEIVGRSQTHFPTKRTALVGPRKEFTEDAGEVILSPVARNLSFATKRTKPKSEHTTRNHNPATNIAGITWRERSDTGNTSDDSSSIGMDQWEFESEFDFEVGDGDITDVRGSGSIGTPSYYESENDDSASMESSVSMGSSVSGKREISRAIALFKAHAKRLGIDERDLLRAVQESEVEYPAGMDIV